jgi:hypothetical protein
MMARVLMARVLRLSGNGIVSPLPMIPINIIPIPPPPIELSFLRASPTTPINLHLKLHRWR